MSQNFYSGNVSTAIDTQRVLEVKILNKLNATGGGGGATQQVYQDRDPAAPDDPTFPAISFPTGGGTVTQWDVASQTWK